MTGTCQQHFYIYLHNPGHFKIRQKSATNIPVQKTQSWRQTDPIEFFSRYSYKTSLPGSGIVEFRIGQPLPQWRGTVTVSAYQIFAVNEKAFRFKYGRVLGKRRSTKRTCCVCTPYLPGHSPRVLQTLEKVCKINLFPMKIQEKTIRHSFLKPRNNNSIDKGWALKKT